ncbi:MAG: hypothetical protein IKE34_06235 [Paenibacillus sp.]|uniref:Membrane-spanning protein n=1 Tax=Paenibacillus aquistagni TaxID=1852522 RepID=A0A1X7LBQ1_9BACL|nr:hypothetical protein [Paenibacillus aquistagni]MBR2568767.1 hypothetical protein [Paenibacillus sp.]SMG50924.1 hypothetical protein SAMN06295960_3200 [Paenibacillus aquistagni]
MTQTTTKQRWNDGIELLLYIICVISFIVFAVKGNVGKCFQAVLIVVTLLLLRGLIIWTKSELPAALRFSILLFIALTMMVANMFSMYGFIPYLDKIEHLLSGVILAFVGMYLYSRLIKSHESPGMPAHKLGIWFSLWFAIAMAGVWEIYEFTVDHLFGLNSQNGSLTDTMLDMICGTIGAIIAALYLRFTFRKK